jgi:Ca2+-binding EF-hand superfamily protein
LNWRIINICGVFPHRDHYFGRQTSAEGKLLLEDPTLRFDLPLVSESGSVQFGTDPSRLWQATLHTFDVLDRLNSLAEKYKHSDVRDRSSNIDWMSDEQVAFCKDTFKKFDKNGDNSLSVDELLSVLHSVGRAYSIERVQEAIEIITGHSGRRDISFEEFATLLQSDLVSHEDEQMLERFRLFDADGSGTISLEELRICIRNHDALITNAEIEAMLKQADRDGDGHIDYQEFYDLIQVGRKDNIHPSNQVEKSN